jgi:hypothetical protein
LRFDYRDCIIGFAASERTLALNSLRGGALRVPAQSLSEKRTKRVRNADSSAPGAGSVGILTG